MIELTENQKKVITDKYLFKGETVEQMFKRIAHNIALAEILYMHPSFSDVKYAKVKETYFFHAGLTTLPERDKNHSNLIKELELISRNEPFKSVVATAEDKFYKLLTTFKFLPGSPTLMNAGASLQQLSSCFVVDVPDSIDGINYALSSAAIIQKTGGGVGFNFGKIRPKGSMVRSTKGVASGVLSFMRVFNSYTDVIKQGGKRRGAMIAVLPYYHPEIMDFLKAKAVYGDLVNFNISVGLDDKFFKLLESKSSFDLVDPSNNKTVGTMKAQELFDILVENAWKSGDPGILFLDRINNEHSNPTPALGNIEAVNPCVTGDTLIAVADGRGAVAIQALAEAGKPVNVYCIDTANTVVVKRMFNIRKTGTAQDILKITTANGLTLRMTLNHNCILSDGSTKPANALVVGDVLRSALLNKKSKSVRNETITAIEADGTADVYNGTVDMWHNYLMGGLAINDLDTYYVNVKNCGELNLHYWESCNLGSLNLSKYISNGEWNIDELNSAIDTAVQFLDNVIEVNNYPLPEIERVSKSMRRIGLGVMGWAEALVMLGIPYNSEAAQREAEYIMGTISARAWQMSKHLAKERGEFLNYEHSILPEPTRNCSVTTIAPTGTIAIAAGLQGSGIEPFFGVAYTRYNAKALEAISEGKKPNESDIFFEVNPLFREIAKNNNYFGLTETELFTKIDKNHKTLTGIKEIPLDIQRLFTTAHDVSVEDHIKMQASFQKYVDCSISKTVNMLNSATKEDVAKAYKMAFAEGCKGITIYRDGCKATQPLNLDNKHEKKAENAVKTPEITQKLVKKIKKQGEPEDAKYYKYNTGYGPLHVNITHEGSEINQIFTVIPPIGTEISGLTALVGVLLSKYFELGGKPENIIKHLNSIRGDKPVGLGPNKVESIPHAISKAISNFIKKDIHKEPGAGSLHCPKCYSTNVSYQGGCSEPTCHDCGYAKCS